MILYFGGNANAVRFVLGIENVSHLFDETVNAVAYPPEPPPIQQPRVQVEGQRERLEPRVEPVTV